LFCFSPASRLSLLWSPSLSYRPPRAHIKSPRLK
jgi:hypothetical protein